MVMKQSRLIYDMSSYWHILIFSWTSFLTFLATPLHYGRYLAAAMYLKVPRQQLLPDYQLLCTTILPTFSVFRMRMGTSSYMYHHQQTRPSHNATLLYVTVSHIMCYLCLYVAAACCVHVCLPVETRDQLAAAPSTTQFHTFI